MSKLLLGLSWLMMGACSSEGTSRPPPIVDGDADADTDADADADADDDCIDIDGDGFGLLCDSGGDCDDDDPTAWDDCSACPVGIVREGCPCEGSEEPADCHSDELYEDEHGRLRCYTGLRSCEDQGDGTFVWGECVISDEPV